MASSIQKSPRGRSEEVGPKSKKADSIVSGSLSHCGLCRFHASLYSSWSLYCLLFRNHLIRYSPYWESSGSKGNPNEMVAS